MLQTLLLCCLEQAPKAPSAHHRLSACQCWLQRLHAACTATHAPQVLLTGLNDRHDRHLPLRACPLATNRYCSDDCLELQADLLQSVPSDCQWCLRTRARLRVHAGHPVKGVLVCIWKSVLRGRQHA